MTKIRIGVAGANGAFGTKHLEALSEIADAQITAVMATSMEKQIKRAILLMCRIVLMIMMPFWRAKS